MENKKIIKSNNIDKKNKKDAIKPELEAKSTIKRKGFSPFQVKLIQSILTSTLTDGMSLDKAYAKWFAKVKLEPIEQGFIIKQINAMFRRLSFYAFLSGLKRPSDMQRHINRLIICYCYDKNYDIPQIDATEGFERSKLAKRLQEANEDILLSQGCPIWLEEQASKELKELWPAMREALNTEPKRYIRANLLKTTREELGSLLSDEGVVTKGVKGFKDALEVTSSAALFRTKAFKNGLFEQQDIGSQEICAFANVQNAKKVIDACAGSGGKTLALSAYMKGKGQIIALDTQEYKLQDLKKRAKRAGAFNIETRAIDNSKVIKRLYDKADVVLIDAPCSGTGVIRRTVDSKWKDSRAHLKELYDIQANILDKYSKMVKVGGFVIYSTCSILPSENEEQINKFLNNHADKFVLIEQKNTDLTSGCDGFYMAKLQRIG